MAALESMEREKSLLMKAVGEAFDRLLVEQRNLAGVLQKLRDRTSQMDRLEAENARLEKQLQTTLSRDQSNITAQLTERDDLNIHSPPSSSRHRNADYQQLEKKYNKVLGECEQLKVVNKDLYTRLNHAQTKLRNWNRFSSPRLPSSPSIAPTVRDEVNDPRKDAREALVESQEPLLPPVCNPQNGNKPQGLTQAIRRRSIEQHGPEISPKAPLILDLEGSDVGDSSTQPDEVTDVNNLKRKHSEMEDENPSFDTPPRTADDASNPVTVKSESSSSSFVQQVQHVVDIPSSNPEDLNRSRRPPTPKRPKSGIPSSRGSEELPPIAMNQMLRPAVPTDIPRQLEGMQDDDADETQEPSGVENVGTDAAASNKYVTETHEKQQSVIERTPLKQLDGNTKILPRTGGPATRWSRKRRTGPEAVHRLAEDGEKTPTQSTHTKKRSFKEIAETSPNHEDRVSMYQRLDHLLSTPTPGRPSTVPLERPRQMETNPVYPSNIRRLTGQDRADASSSEGGLHDFLPAKVGTSRALPQQAQNNLTSKHRATHRSTPSVKNDEKHNLNTSHSEPPRDASPSDEPLRARPCNRLSLEDFKINPAENSGLTYAYKDVVRGHSARKCLPGCTRPECCGTKFRALAADLPILSTSQDEHDLLQSYLPPSQTDLNYL